MSSRFNTGIISLDVKQKKDNLTPSEIHQKNLKKKQQLEIINSSLNYYNREERLLGDGEVSYNQKSPGRASNSKAQISLLNSPERSSDNDDDEDEQKSDYSFHADLDKSEQKLNNVLEFVSKVLVNVDILEENAADDQNTINYLADTLNQYKAKFGELPRQRDY